jgi:biotin synthase-like enzyme
MEQKLQQARANQQGKYDPSIFLHVEDIKLEENTRELLKEAEQVYFDNFNGKTGFGRCIFLSWYCSANCTFCFRGTPENKTLHPAEERRSMGSLLVEALLCKILNWRLEFITGGFGIMPFSELLEIIKNVHAVYGKKLWLNLGILSDEQLEQVRPYVEGICLSMETLHPKIHKQVCPMKPLKAYEKRMATLQGFKKSIAVIVGLGDTIEDMHYLFEFIEKNGVQRVTLYALKPIRGSPFTKGPSVEEYLTWIAKLRIRFPTLEIIAGTNLRRSEEVGYLMQAGVSSITKFPASKQFGTEKAKLLKRLIEESGRKFTSNLTDFPHEVDWEGEIDACDLSDEHKQQMKEKLPLYLQRLQNPVDKDKSMSKNTPNKDENKKPLDCC